MHIHKRNTNMNYIKDIEYTKLIQRPFIFLEKVVKIEMKLIL